MVTIVLATISATALCALWRILHNYVVANPTDNLPGPQPSSIVFGASYSIFGWWVLMSCTR